MVMVATPSLTSMPLTEPAAEPLEPQAVRARATAETSEPARTERRVMEGRMERGMVIPSSFGPVRPWAGLPEERGLKWRSGAHQWVW